MKVVYTDQALRDIESILIYIAGNYPAAYEPFKRRLRAAVTRIAAWPRSAAEVAQRPGVRVVPLRRFPYKLFYRISQDAVEVPHVHHAARQESRGRSQ